MSGDKVRVAKDAIFGPGNTLPDGFTAATPLGQLAQGSMPSASLCDSIIGFIPGCIGETSVIAIAIDAIILLGQASHHGRPWAAYSQAAS